MTKIQIRPEYGIPESFFAQSNQAPCCVIMITCDPSPGCPYMGSPPEFLTGYTADNFKAGGAGFWFSLIHPDDIQIVSGKVIDAHEALTVRNPVSWQAIPLLLRYRFKHADGHYIHIKDSRFLLSQNGEGVIDEILCRFELLGEVHGEDKMLHDLLQKRKSCNKILEAAFLRQNYPRKHLLGMPMEGKYLANRPGATAINELIPRLTPREKEILRMIADGLSSKMIADKCKISINTVETHRRHLLDKLKVRNSMELIKEASKVFIL